MQNRMLGITALVVLSSALYAVLSTAAAGEEISALSIALILHIVIAACAMLAPAVFAPEQVEPLDEEARIKGVATTYGLSPREHEVLGAYVRNRDIRACANELFISPGTVKAHLSHIYGKTGVGNRVELLQLCDMYPRLTPAA